MSRRPLDRYRFLTRKCRRWLPCNARDGFHTHHLVLIIPPFRKSAR